MVITAIRDCLAGATLFLNAGIAAYTALGCKQCAIPAEKGLLLGQVIEDRLALRPLFRGMSFSRGIGH